LHYSECLSELILEQLTERFVFLYFNLYNLNCYW